MDPDIARHLTSEAGARALDRARELRDTPAHRRASALADCGRPAEIRAVLPQDDLRRRAAPRCPQAERLLFTTSALEQATAWPVAIERQSRWPRPVEVALTDLGAGIGLDALAAAQSGRRVEAWERDEARAHLLRHNVTVLGLGERVRVHEGDVLEARPAGALAFLDPGRRPGGQRTRDPDRFEPPREAWRGLLASFEAALVKLPPSASPPLEGPLEVVALDGRARETRVAVGAHGPLPARRALSLPSGAAVEGEGIPWPAARAPREGDWLLDPDPSVTLAGLVGDLAAAADLAPVHPRIAYLVGTKDSTPRPGRWVRVEAVLRPRAREIDAWLHARGIGRLTVRTRGVKDSVEAWRRRLHPRGPLEGTVVCTRGPDGRWIALGGTESDTRSA